MLQKRFVGPDGKLFYFDKREPSKGVRCTGAGNLLLEGHLYSLKNPDGTRDVSLELNYARLEAATRSNHFEYRSIRSIEKTSSTYASRKRGCVLLCLSAVAPDTGFP